MTTGNEIKKVLIFDDDRDYRNLVKAYLAKSLPDTELVEYDPVANGAPGEDFDWSGYDVMVLDYYLCIYGTTGLDILQKNRKKPGFPATIMLTGAGDEEVAMRALDFGVYEYLRKEKLTKEELLKSVNDAYRKHQEKLIKQKEQERVNKAFDKTLFYKQLEHPKDVAINNKERVLLLIGIDNLDDLAIKFGLIVVDNLLRHVARLCFEKFSSTDSNPCITRLGDSSIGVLIDSPESMELLGNRMRDLCEYLSGNNYSSGDNVVTSVASIGILILDCEGKSISSLIELAGQARDIARQTNENSWHIYTLTEILKSTIKLQQEEEQRRKAEEERLHQAELERQRKEEVDRLRHADELRRQAEDEARQRLAELERESSLEEERLHQEEEQRRQAEETERQRLLVEEKNREEEQRNKAEEERIRQEKEKNRKAVAEQLRQTELERQQREQDKRQKDLIKEQQRQKAENERRIAEGKERQRQIAEQKRAAELEQNRWAELERQRQEEQRRQEEEQKRKEEESRLRQAELEQQRKEEERLQKSEIERQHDEQEKSSRQQDEQTVTDIRSFPLEAETFSESTKTENTDSVTWRTAEEAEVSNREVDTDAGLDEFSLALKKAFNDNRIMQAFQPVVAMFSPQPGDISTIFKVDFQIVDLAGTIKPAGEFNRQNVMLSLQQDIDHWMLREIIGRVARSEDFRSGKMYMLVISEAWLKDITLFTWLKELLIGVENIKPGKFIALEIPAGMLVAHKKRALALIRVLKNSHGFAIGLGSIDTFEELASLAGLLDFNLLAIRYPLIKKILCTPGYNVDINFLKNLKNLKSRGARIIIDGIEDSTMLTEAISLGADYVMGNFIGEPQSNQAGTGNVETFDISY